MDADSKIDSGKQSNLRQRREGERGKRHREKTKTRESSYLKQSDSCQAANQLSSALTNLGIVLFTSDRALLPNQAGQGGQVSARRLTAVTHTALHGGHLLSQPADR